MHLSRLLDNLPPYHFADYNRKIAERRAAGADIINLSMGDPDLPTPPEVVEALAEAARDPANQRYPEYAGMPELRIAFAGWFARRFGVTLDPTREVLPLMGSKEGLAHLPWATMNPGEVALLTDPAYPVYPTAVALAGGESYLLPLDRSAGWLPDLTAVPAEVLKRARALWLNYPHNPTGATAAHSFFEEAVRFARAYDLLLVHDTAYAEVRFEGARPSSVLEVEGAKEVAVEFHSLSKAYNMAGFRVGMLVGNATVVGGMTRFKTNLDSGMFRPIQIAAMCALSLPESWLDARNAIYQARRDRLVAAFRRMGMEVDAPQAGLYLWPRIPEDYSAQQFALELLERADVAVTPGTNFGAHGEGYVRVSLTSPEARIDEAIARMEAAMVAHAT
jgi:LL-diaminopimelate aminotransferase